MIYEQVSEQLNIEILPNDNKLMYLRRKRREMAFFQLVLSGTVIQTHYRPTHLIHPLVLIVFNVFSNQFHSI